MTTYATLISPERVSKIVVVEDRNYLDVLRVLQGTSEQIYIDDGAPREVTISEDGYILQSAIREYGFENYSHWFFKEPNINWVNDPNSGKFYMSFFKASVFTLSSDDPDVVISFQGDNEKSAAEKLSDFLVQFPHLKTMP